MMTLVHKTHTKGATLLELVIGIIIIGLISTMGLVAYNSQGDDKKLRKAAIEIEGLASKGHTRAFLQQTPHRLSLVSPNEIILETPSKNSENEIVGYQKLESYKSEVAIALRRWGAKEDEWFSPKSRKTTQDPSQYWYFSATGLCEPISIKLSENENWIILHLDPLTARVKDQESHIAN